MNNTETCGAEIGCLFICSVIWGCKCDWHNLPREPQVERSLFSAVICTCQVVFGSKIRLSFLTHTWLQQYTSALVTFLIRFTQNFQLVGRTQKRGLLRRFNSTIQSMDFYYSFSIQNLLPGKERPHPCPWIVSCYQTSKIQSLANWLLSFKVVVITQYVGGIGEVKFGCRHFERQDTNSIQAG